MVASYDLHALTLPFPLFVKPLAEGTGKGINKASHIKTMSELTAHCHHLLHSFHQPVLVERFLPGHEFTVGIVGNGHHAKVVGVMEILLIIMQSKVATHMKIKPITKIASIINLFTMRKQSRQRKWH